MALYIVTGCYTGDAMKGMLAHPSDREAATRTLCEAGGGKLLSYYLTTGDSDFSMVVQSDNYADLLPSLIVAGASGAITNLRSVQAFTSAEFKSAQEKAGRLAAKYSPPN